MRDDNVNNREKLKQYLWVKEIPGEYEQSLLEKVAKYTSLFQRIPWVSCICICNSLAMNACHKWSDIDLFVITRKNRLWTARIFMTLLLTLIWQKKTAKNHAWKFCLSFFITEDNLNLQEIAIENDIYLKYWIETLRPILNRNRSYQKFMQENSSWLNLEKTSFPKNISPFHMRGFFLIRYLWNLLELSLKTLFLPRTKKSFQKLWKPFWIVISDTMLKFHNKDKRREIRDELL